MVFLVMLFVLKVFLVFILFYHVINTIFVYGIFSEQYGFLFSLSKEVIFLCIFSLFAVINFKYILPYIKRFKILLSLLFGFLVRSIIISYFQDKTIYEILIGIRYNIYFVCLFLVGSFVGYICYNKKFEDKIYGFMNFLFYLLLVGLVVGVVRQGLKLGFDELFYKLGYGKIGTYEAGENPPIYYLTGYEGIPRFSGIFAGPNNLGFLLVLFFSFFMHKSYTLSGSLSLKKFEWNKFLKKNSLALFYLILGILTLSRGFIVGIIIQVYYFFINIFGKSRKYLYYFIGGIFLLILLMSLFKRESTKEHFIQSFGSLHYVFENSFGYGLGTSGPSTHYVKGEEQIIPENVYLQVMIDTGSIGFILWVTIFFVIFLLVRKYLIVGTSHFSSKEKEMMHYFVLLSLGLFGLLIEGLFLHIFEDYMVNYLFFIPYGILFGYFVGKYCNN